MQKERKVDKADSIAACLKIWISADKDADAISSEARNKATMHHFIDEVYQQGTRGNLVMCS